MTGPSVTRRAALVGLGFSLMAAGTALTATKATADNYPEKPVTIVVPFNTGGWNDRYARAMSSFLHDELGQPVVVVNRPGAGGLLGHTYLMQQPDDGHTIMVTSATPYIANNILLQDAPFKMDDFAYINMPSRDFTFIASAQDKPYKSIDDLVAAIRENPGRISLGVQTSSADYVNLMLMLDALDISPDDIRMVTYNGGGPLRTAMAGGHVDAGFVGAEGSLPLRDILQPLLVFRDARSDDWDAPAYPEFLEQNGAQGEMVVGSIRGFGVRASFRDKHPERFAKLVEAIEKTSKREDVIAALQRQDLSWEWYGPEESTETLRRAFDGLERHSAFLRQQEARPEWTAAQSPPSARPGPSPPRDGTRNRFHAYRGLQD